jgi:arsenate reductase (thioredoxin)
MMLTILFLCKGNSCRSQMAEAWARQLKSSQIEAYSAGTEPRGVDPRAVKAMAEVGVDISGQKSKSLEAVQDISFDYVITLCDDLATSCPVFPARLGLVHRAFDDPPALTKNASTEEEAMQVYRRVRDEIRRYIEQMPDVLRNKEDVGA